MPTMIGEHFPPGGGGEIRTRDNVAAILLFESSAFNHSATPPRQSLRVCLVMATRQKLQPNTMLLL